MLLNCGIEEDSWESLAFKEIQPVHPKDQSWVFIGRTYVEDETPMLWPTHWQRPQCWDRLRAGREGDNRGWDGWTQWTWVWTSSGSWWWTGKPGVLQSMGWQRVGHDWVTELNWMFLYQYLSFVVMKVPYSCKMLIGETGSRTYGIFLYCLCNFSWNLKAS